MTSPYAAQIKLTADWSDEDKQAAYAWYREHYAAQVRGVSLNGYRRTKRKGIKARKRSYTDTSTATEEYAT